MQGKYKDLLEESIVRLEEKLATLDPTTDEYRKVNECLERQYRLKIEEEKYEEDTRLRENHEANEELAAERAHEEQLRKNRNDKIFTVVKIGMDVLVFAAGAVFNGVWAGRWMKFEESGTVCSGWMKNFLRDHSSMRQNKLG